MAGGGERVGEHRFTGDVIGEPFTFIIAPARPRAPGVSEDEQQKKPEFLMPTACIYKPGTGACHKTLYADQGVVGFGFEGQAEAFRKAIATGLVGLASLPASSSIPDFQRDGKRESQSKVARQWEVLRGLQPGDVLIAVEGTKWAVGVALLTADPVSPEESERLASLTVQEEPHSIFVRARWHLFQAPLEMKFVSGANAAQETIYRVTPARAVVLLEHLDRFGLQATAREQVVTALSSAKDGASESTPEPKRRLMAARYSWLLGHGCADGNSLSVQVSNTAECRDRGDVYGHAGLTVLRADPTAAGGIADLTTAYNTAAGLSLCPIVAAGNLGGQTLTPGLYKSTSSIEVSSGDLTLDAQGDSSAVWIFQIASTLTTTAGRQVILTNGALAENVYWQVGTSATIGTTSAFVGTIMADQSVTLETGASLNGRALARIAAVTLDTNIVTTP